MYKNKRNRLGSLEGMDIMGPGSGPRGGTPTRTFGPGARDRYITPHDSRQPQAIASDQRFLDEAERIKREYIEPYSYTYNPERPHRSKREARRLGTGKKGEPEGTPWSKLPNDMGLGYNNPCDQPGDPCEGTAAPLCSVCPPRDGYDDEGPYSNWTYSDQECTPREAADGFVCRLLPTGESPGGPA